MQPLPESSLGRSRPEWITPDQAALWQEFIRFAFEFGLLDREEVEEVLRGFVLRDVDDREWTVGADSGQWYRRDPQGRWMVAEPPPALRPPTLDLSPYRRPSAAASEAEALVMAASPAVGAVRGGGAPPPRPPGLCGLCGTQNAPTSRFCTGCGRPVSG